MADGISHKRFQDVAGQEHADRRLQVQGLPQAFHRQGRNHLRGQPYSHAALVAGDCSTQFK
jgi:hypothetical protein